MNHHDIATIAAEPLLVAPTHAHAMLEALRREPGAEAYDHALDVAAVYGVTPSAPEKAFAFADGVAFIPVRGSLMNRTTASYSWVTGYKGIIQRVAAAVADPDVRGIVLDVDSYGGEAAGCFECAAEVRAMIRESGKPSLAMVDSNAYSAGYALAVAADRVAIIPSGGAGSIGVITMHVDFSKALDNYGVKYTLIYSGKHKADGNPYEALPDDVRAATQARVDSKREAFIAHVAAMRSMDPQRVRDTEADAYEAGKALELGLVDAVMTAPAALAQFQSNLPAPSGAFFMEANMADPTAPDVATVQADARSAEKARCAAILNHAEAAGRADLAAHLAFETDMSADQAAAMLAKAPRAAAAAPAAAATANPLEAAMAAKGTPGVGADDAAGTTAPKADSAEFLLASLALATGQKAG